MYYKESLRQKGKNGESRLFDNKYSLNELKITLQIDSPVDEARFNDIKSDLHLYLRKRLQNKNLNFEIEMVAVEKKKMIYTPQEKFDHLAKKNPSLIELKNRLGLEFEF